MATAKKTRPAAKKSVPVKPVSKKPVKGKPVPKSSATAKKTSPVKSKTTIKSKSSTISKKTSAVKPVSKKTKVVTPIPQKKSVSKPLVKEAPLKNKPVSTKSVVPTKTSAKAPAKKEIVPSKVINPKTVPVKAISKPVIPATKQDKKTPVAKEIVTPLKKGKTPAPAPIVKQDEKLDPLHVKAAKAMKELEETMDLSKVRPRIQAGSPPPAPKPPSRHVAPPLKLVEPTNTSKIKFQLEFEFRSSPKILYNYLRDPDGLAGWFADEVKTKDNLFTFIWEGSESYAKLVASKDQHLVRFQWTEETDGTYFQFEIKEDDITADVALIITDFANPGEKDTNARLWESQVQKLRLLLGSF